MAQSVNLPSVKPDNLDDKNLSELLSFSYALNEKIRLSEEMKKYCFIKILQNIVRDIEKTIRYYENNSMSFSDAYEEILSLYIFSEIYLPLDLSGSS